MFLVDEDILIILMVLISIILNELFFELPTLKHSLRNPPNLFSNLIQIGYNGTA